MLSLMVFLLSQINALHNEVYFKADENDIAENEFIVGGYSWMQKEFKIWRYRYSRFERKFEKQEFDTSFENRFGKIVFAGDQKQSLIKELLRILKKKYGNDYEKYSGQKFDMEPFEALVALLRKATAQDTIGGAPQMVKIYSHMNCRPIGVYWPEEVEGEPDMNRTLLGRKLFDTEKCDYSFINPDTCYSCKRQF